MRLTGTRETGLYIEGTALNLLALALDVVRLAVHGTVGAEGFHQPHQSRRAQRDEAKRNETDVDGDKPTPPGFSSARSTSPLGDHADYT